MGSLFSPPGMPTPPPPPQAPSASNAMTAQQMANSEALQRKPQGQASTVLTGPQGLDTSNVQLARTSLLGN